jgi:hypothetical protein
LYKTLGAACPLEALFAPATKAKVQTELQEEFSSEIGRMAGR